MEKNQNKRNTFSARIYTLAMALAVCFMLGTPVASLAQAQNRTVKVTDTDGTPLAGVAVIVKESTRGTSTGANGEATISASPGETLILSFLGFAEKEVTVAGQLRYEVVMEMDVTTLDDVVVIGYGAIDRKRVTTSITSVKGDDLTLGLGGSSIGTALQGKIPGMVISANASPNQSNSFQLRGPASIIGSSAPLIVVDGIPGGDIRAINNEDIESIDVLQDASAGAIYGTRAAGGVILITTKKPTAGKMTLSYNGEFSLESVKKTPELLSAGEYVEYGIGPDYGYDSDWYKAMTRNNPFSHKQSVTMSGGSENATVYASFMTQDYPGIVIGDSRKDYSGRVNSHFKFLDGIVEVRLNAQYREAQREQKNGNNHFWDAIIMDPTVPIMNPDDPSKYNVTGTGLAGSIYSPVADIMLQDYNGKDSWILADAHIKINVAQGISLESTLGYQKADWHLYRYYSHEHRGSIDNNRNGQGYQGYDKSMWNTYEAFANFDRTYNGHRIEATGGYSFWEKNREYFNMTNYDFTSDGKGAWDMGAGTWLNDGRASMSSGKNARDRLIAGFGRLNYSYKDKYMVSATYRREGSTSFGANNRWGNFWGASLGWRLTQEEFMAPLHQINDIKIRASYGVTGNNNGLSADNTTFMLKSDVFYPSYNGGKWITSYGGSRNVNYDLRWEEKHELNVGFDFSMFGSRLFGSFDYYNRQAKKLLFNVNSPQPPKVYGTEVKNIGTLENKGVEVVLGGHIVRKGDWNYSSTIRLSNNRSRIKNTGMEEGDYYEYVTFPSPGNPGNGVRINHDGSGYGKFFVYKYAGIDDQGRWQIYNKDNEVITVGVDDFDPTDKHHVGNAIPKVIMSWEHSLSYKNFDLFVSLRSWIKYDVFSQTNMYLGLPSTSGDNVYKKAYTKNGHITSEKILTDYFIEDGTFLNIDVISLGYTLNLSQYNRIVNKARFYLTIRDAARWTKFSGLNPEVDITGITPGFEYIKQSYTTYPQTVRFTLGVQLTF